MLTRKSILRRKWFWALVVGAFFLVVLAPHAWVHFKFRGAVGLSPEQAVSQYGEPLITRTRTEGLQISGVSWTHLSTEKRAQLLASGEFEFVYIQSVGYSAGAVLRFRQGHVAMVEWR